MKHWTWGQPSSSRIAGRWVTACKRDIWDRWIAGEQRSVTCAHCRRALDEMAEEVKAWEAEAFEAFLPVEVRA